MKKTFAILAGFAVIGGSSASVLTQWDFNQYTDTASQSVLLTAGSSIGTGLASLTTSTDAKSVLSNDGVTPASSDPNQATGAFWSVGNFQAQGVGSGLAGVVFATSTVGESNISVSFDQRWTKHTSEFGQVQYTTDGSTWLNADSAHGVTGSYANGLVDGLFTLPTNGSSAADSEGFTDGINFNFSNTAGVANNAKFAFREVAVFAPGTQNYTQAFDGTSAPYGGATSGRWKFDMVTINAQAVPEPSSVAILGLGLLGIIVKRRK